jgi:23S rRNA pseudouridine2605 synthase
MTDSAPDRPERLLARLGIASRREIARWVEAGRLRADGHVLKGGERITTAMSLSLDGRRLQLPKQSAPRRVILYHKPEGEVVTRHDTHGRPEVFSSLPKVSGGRWVVVGRLDIATTGLLLFTTDGELAARLMHPRHELERRYLVRVRGELDNKIHQRLLGGGGVGGWPCSLPRLSAGGARQWQQPLVPGEPRRGTQS